MSTYAVFGMTRHRALEAARKTVETSEKDKETGAWFTVPESEWLARVEAKADKIMAGTRVIQLSEKFDAPQFARAFLDLASKYESRDLKIKAYRTSGERNPKTGRPVMYWDDQISA